MNYSAYYDAYPCHFLLAVQPETITLVTAVPDENGQPGETVHPDLAGLTLRASPEFNISVDDIKARSDAKDCCWWGIIDKMDDYFPGGIVNLTAMSYAPRMPLSLARYGRNVNTQVQFFLPYLNGDFTEADFCVSLREGFRLLTNIPFTTVARNEIGNLRNEGMLEITLSAPDTALPDFPVTVGLQVTRRGQPIPHPVDIELETVGGYLPKPRIRTDENGEGQFRVIPLGLLPGDSFKVKAGFRFFAGLGEKTIQVVENV